MAEKLTIGFLGAGKMATALAKGFIQAGLTTPKLVMASDPVDAARKYFFKETGAKTTQSNAEVVRFSKVLVLAVKPGNAAELLQEISGGFTEKHLLISIAAGVPIAKLESGLGNSARVIRVMPNTPALVGSSATAFAPGQAAKAEDAKLAEKLFSAVGIAFQLKESLLDAVT